MYATSILSVALLASSALVNVGAVAVVPRAKPATYYESILEKYSVYHTRYLALNCQLKHNTQFFDDCCHPLKKGETLKKNRKAYCTPSAPASSSAAVAEPTSTVVPSPEDETPAPPSADPEDDDEDGDDDEEPCDDDGDDDDEEPPAKPPTTSSPAKPPPSPPAPKPTTSKATSTTADAPTKTSSTPKPASGSGAFKSGGIATFFTQNGVPGACGKVHKDSEFVAALTSKYYGNFGKKSDNCGRKIEVISVEHPDRKVIVTAADGCPTCPDPESLDLSTAAFLKLATKREGIAKIKWRFIS